MTRSTPTRMNRFDTYKVLFWVGTPMLLLVGGTITQSIRLESIIHPSHYTLNTSYQPEVDEMEQAEQGIRECTVTLISGRKITGELIRQDSLIVIIGINGIETTFQRNRVASVVILAPVAVRYNEMRNSIPDRDIDARLSLVEWLRERQAYELAISELESILLVDPNNPKAKLLHRWLTEYDKLESTSTPDAEAGDPSSAPDSAGSQRPQRNDISPLSAEQINLIRVYEIDLRDPPKIKIPDETLRTLILQNPDAFSPNEDERKALFQLPEIDKLRLLFTHKARDLYGQVQVLEDPKSMDIFRTQVHSQRGWFLNACATTRCHGGPEAGTFQVINSRPNSIETIYTNFAIIESYTLKNGTSLINYDAPERSPLLQMAMIEKNSLSPHPEIPREFSGARFRPIFRSTRDRKYRDAIDWIRSMYQPRPEYGFISQIQPEPKPNDTDEDPKSNQSEP